MKDSSTPRSQFQYVTITIHIILSSLDLLFTLCNVGLQGEVSPKELLKKAEAFESFVESLLSKA